jgi:hypothetical protein
MKKKLYLIERKTPIPLGSGMKANALRWESSFQKGGSFRFKRITGSPILKEGTDRLHPTVCSQNPRRAVGEGVFRVRTNRILWIR